MRRDSLETSRSLAALLAACALGAAAWAQQPGKPAPQPAPAGDRAPDVGAPPPEMGDEGPMSPEQARAMVQRRLDDAKAEVERLEKAMSMLDEGASPPEVRRALAEGRDRPAFNQRPRGGPGAAAPGERRRPGADGAMAPDDMRPGPDGQPGGGRRPAPLGPEAQQRLLEFLRQHHPQMADKIEALRKDRPMLAERMMGELSGQLRELRELREHDPKMFEIRLRAFRLDWEMRETAFEYLRATHPREGEAPPAGAPNAEAVRARLMDLADKRFGVSLDEKAHQMSQMAERMEHLKVELSDSGERRAEIVRKRVDAMLEHLERVRSGKERPPEGGPGERPNE